MNKKLKLFIVLDARIVQKRETRIVHKREYQSESGRHKKNFLVYFEPFLIVDFEFMLIFNAHGQIPPRQ